MTGDFLQSLQPSFLCLPPEIRNQIYRALVKSDGIISIPFDEPFSRSPGWVVNAELQRYRINRQLWGEIKPIFYEQNAFRLFSPSCHCLEPPLANPHFSLIRRLFIDLSLHFCTLSQLRNQSHRRLSDQEAIYNPNWKLLRQQRAARIVDRLVDALAGMRHLEILVIKEVDRSLSGMDVRRVMEPLTRLRIKMLYFNCAIGFDLIVRKGSLGRLL